MRSGSGVREGETLSEEPRPDLSAEAAPYLLTESPLALRERMKEAEAALQEAVRRKSIAAEDVRRAESALKSASDDYLRALEAAVDEQRLAASAPLVRHPGLPDILDADVRLILKRMNGWDEQEHAAAQQELRKTGIRAVGPLLRVMQKEALRRDRFSMAVAGLSVFAIVLSLLGMANGVGSGSEPFFVFLLLVLVSLVNTTRPTRMQKRAAEALANYDDARVIGPLAEGLELDDNYTRGVAAAALRRLLPRVRASDAGLVSREHLQKLYRALSSDDLNLVLAVLHGLEQIGDEEAIPHVEKLTTRPAFSQAERNVRAAANDCLPGLQARLGRQGVGATLLRAASSPVGDEEDLLRPAARSALSSGEPLLRAVMERENT